MSKTQAEHRSNIDHELFSITDEMKQAMEKARISQLGRFADFEDAGCYEVKNNFRAYDQSQSFFITVTKDKFLDAGHPAAIIDTIIERLDLETLYVQYSKEGNPPYHPKMIHRDNELQNDLGFSYKPIRFYVSCRGAGA